MENNNKGAVFLEKLTEVFVSEERSSPFKSKKVTNISFLRTIQSIHNIKH